MIRSGKALPNLNFNDPSIQIMAAPHIPNLTTFRSGPNHPRSPGRGRGRDLPGNPTSSTIITPSGDEAKSTAKARIVQLTDQDASISRWSAVEAGYLNDPFARLFTATQAQRRFPIINRGMYVCLAHYTLFHCIVLSIHTYMPPHPIPMRGAKQTISKDDEQNRDMNKLKRHLHPYHGHR